MSVYFDEDWELEAETAMDVLKSFRLANGKLTAVTPVGSNRFNFPGAQPSISSNGTQNGIVWELQTDGYNSNGPAILHAYDALNLAKELYRSDRETVTTAASAGTRSAAGRAGSQTTWASTRIAVWPR